MSNIPGQLGGLTKLIYTGPEHKKLLVPAVLALMLCEEHGGIHHFAVVQEGSALALSDVGLKCLEDQGINFDTEDPA